MTPHTQRIPVIARILAVLLALGSVVVGTCVRAEEPVSSAPADAVFDLRTRDWGEGSHFSLAGQWRAVWGALLEPSEMADAADTLMFPVPAQWDQPGRGHAPLPTQGALTYQARIKIPPNISPVYLYMPDMPSAYALFVNDEQVGGNGQPALDQSAERPAFTPQIFKLDKHDGELLLTLQLSNFYYREGGVWFDPKITDESGYFSLAQRPVLFAVFFAAILITLGIYNFSLFLFRRSEWAACFFGLLCFVVGLRRLLIDERVLYSFDLFSWEFLQALEHVCFYLTLPLFVSYFVALFTHKSGLAIARLAWSVCAVFVVICTVYPTRIYTEFNVLFQGIISLAVFYCVLMYVQHWRQTGRAARDFGLSLAVLAIAVLHDVLKANDVFSSPNVAHFGVLAFAVTQSLSLQRRYLRSMKQVERMSQTLKERNAELQQLDAFKDEFLATTSHELRTPLNGIAGLARVLSESAAQQLQPGQQEQLRLIQSTAQRLGSLVNDILDFSSAKHGRLTLHASRVDFVEMTDWVFETLKPTLGEKPVQLSSDIHPEVRYLHVDQYRFQQILFNLLGNAIKFTDAGEISLSAWVAESAVQIEIADTGRGMSDAQQEKLFVAFEQVHEESSFRQGGSGLGLSITRHLVALHEGELQVKSRVGEGTRGAITLPIRCRAENDDEMPQAGCDVSPQDARIEDIARMPNAPCGALHAAQLWPDMDGAVRIFVVDDEQVNRELVRSQLDAQGYDVEVFDSGMALLKTLQEKVPDVVLLDLMMPGMNGFEVCQSIRRDFSAYELPVMMLTARHQVQDIVQALSVGANDYLIKPYNEKELLARLASQVSVRASWIANRENQKLKAEVARREALEGELAELNARLLQVLDVSDEMIVLVNEEMQAIYANGSARESFCEALPPYSQPQQNLCIPLHEWVNEDLSAEVQACLHDPQSLPRWLTTSGQQADELWHCSIRAFEEGGKRYAALLARRAAVDHSLNKVRAPAQQRDALASLTRELSENRRKITQIEGALKQMKLASALESEGPNTTSNTVLPAVKAGVASEEVKARLVALHRLTLNLWERYSGQGKTELADQSRCWRVYIDGTTVKTRTYDKYLSLKTVPDKPRWRAVVRTANYVLAQCPLQAEDKLELQQLTETVEEIFG